MRSSTCLKYSLLIVGVLLFSGCAKPTPRIFWPGLPDTPRLEYIGQYRTEKDLKKKGLAALTEMATGGRMANGINAPTGVAGDAKKMFVADVLQGMVKVFDFETGKVEDFSTQQMGKPFALATDSRGRLYVSDQLGNQVLVYKVTGEPLTVFGKGLIGRPTALGLNESLQRIYVADGVSQQVLVFSLEGDFLFSFGRKGERGSADGQFNVPSGVAVDAQGQVFVVDQLNSRIQVFDADGNFLYKFGERGVRDWQFESPKDIAIDSEGNLWIVDFRKAAMLTYTPKGELLMVTRGTGQTQSFFGFAGPNSIWIDANDRIFVTEWLNRRVSVWQYLNKTYLEQNPIPTPSGGKGN